MISRMRLSLCSSFCSARFCSVTFKAIPRIPTGTPSRTITEARTEIGNVLPSRRNPGASIQGEGSSITA